MNVYAAFGSFLALAQLATWASGQTAAGPTTQAATNAALQERIYVAAEDASSHHPLQGVLVRSTLSLSGAPATPPDGACTTNTQGQCSIRTGRGGDPRHGTLLVHIEASKEGYRPFRTVLTLAPSAPISIDVFATMDVQNHVTVFQVRGTNGNPIAGAAVEGKYNEQKCTTNMGGECFMDSDGTGSVTVTRDGFVNSDASVNFSEGRTYAITLRSMREVVRNEDTLELCVAYGQWLRGEKPPEGDLIVGELARRRIVVNKKLVREEKLQLGMSTCELYASWGWPTTSNRSVGRWGEHVQHVYRSDDTYVYTENGRVTSWQD
jgi:hypothetical protein